MLKHHFIAMLTLLLWVASCPVWASGSVADNGAAAPNARAERAQKRAGMRQAAQARRGKSKTGKETEQ